MARVSYLDKRFTGGLNPCDLSILTSKRFRCRVTQRAIQEYKYQTTLKDNSLPINNNTLIDDSLSTLHTDVKLSIEKMAFFFTIEPYISFNSVKDMIHVVNIINDIASRLYRTREGITRVVNYHPRTLYVLQLIFDLRNFIVENHTPKMLEYYCKLIRQNKRSEMNIPPHITVDDIMKQKVDLEPISIEMLKMYASNEF